MMPKLKKGVKHPGPQPSVRVLAGKARARTEAAIAPKMVAIAKAVVLKRSASEAPATATRQRTMTIDHTDLSGLIKESSLNVSLEAILLICTSITGV